MRLRGGKVTGRMDTGWKKTGKGDETEGDRA